MTVLGLLVLGVIGLVLVLVLTGWLENYLERKGK